MHRSMSARADHIACADGNAFRGAGCPAGDIHLGGGTLGARTLALKGVLLTRLSALHEAATIDVLCADKTGTLTLNEMAVARSAPLKPGYDEADVLDFAALASSAGRPGSDRCGHPRAAPANERRRRAAPSTASASHHSIRPQRWPRRSRSTGARDPHRQGSACGSRRICAMPPRTAATSWRRSSRRISNARGGRRSAGRSDVIGLIAFGDPPRPDSAQLLDRVAIAGRQPDHGHRRCRDNGGDCRAEHRPRWPGLSRRETSPRASAPTISPSMPECFPSRKFRLVKAFQREGHAVGMCGDGANDAPASAPGADGHRGLDRDRCGQGGGRHRADRAGPRRHRRLHQGGALRVSAGADLHAEHSRQQMRRRFSSSALG